MKKKEKVGALSLDKKMLIAEQQSWGKHLEVRRQWLENNREELEEQIEDISQFLELKEKSDKRIILMILTELAASALVICPILLSQYSVLSQELRVFLQEISPVFSLIYLLHLPFILVYIIYSLGKLNQKLRYVINELPNMEDVYDEDFFRSLENWGKFLEDIRNDLLFTRNSSALTDTSVITIEELLAAKESAAERAKN